MNKQHVFDKFDIIYEFYNVKKTFISAVLQWEIERKLVVLTLALLWATSKFFHFVLWCLSVCAVKIAS